MSQRCGSPSGIDLSRPLSFYFDGKQYKGFAGDSIASALLAEGVKVFGRSFKYHRARGLLRSGRAEPNALVQVVYNGHRVPNLTASTVLLEQGMQAFSQNRWPSLRFDLMSITSRLSPVFVAGFYYKTFLWPKSFWTRIYEPVIRRAAGLGSLAVKVDAERYERHSLHCDVLVIGAGVTGLAAAEAALSRGARVVLCEGQSLLGGSALYENPESIGLDLILTALLEHPRCRVLSQTDVFGWYDHQVLAAVETRGAEQRLWRISSQQVVLATGALERPLVFPDNDKPGVMLCSAVREYMARYGVRPWRRALVVSSAADAEKTVDSLLRAGVEVAAVLVDGESILDSSLPCYKNHRISSINNRRGQLSVKVQDRQSGKSMDVCCDLVCMSGGWDPALELAAQRNWKPRWCALRQCFLLHDSESEGCFSAGAAAAVYDHIACIEDGRRAGLRAAAAAGFGDAIESARSQVEAVGGSPEWGEFAAGAKAFLDFQHDVTYDDVALAVREGYSAVEHLKRYTTLGMATDQGRAANVNAIVAVAAMTGKAMNEAGTTRFRPPASPVSIGALAGFHRGEHWRPTRYSPLHDWQARQGAKFVEAGDWLRANYFPAADECMAEAVAREASTVRSGVGLCDVSTLAKFELHGPDALQFIEYVYCNSFANLPVGKARYGVLLREDGIIFDDGTITRFDEHHYFLTSTTSNAAATHAHLTYCQQVLMPEARISLSDVSDDWAAIAVSGPQSRALLQRCFDSVAWDGVSLPALHARKVELSDGTEMRLMRMSFTGELGFELYLPANRAEVIIDALHAQSDEFQFTLYGEEALDVLRVEKGHIASELNGLTSPGDLGLERFVAKKKHYIGKAMLQRSGMQCEQRLSMVGLRAQKPEQAMPAGAHLLEIGASTTLENDQGYITSSAWSPSLQAPIALALVKNGARRHGERLRVVELMQGLDMEVELVCPIFVDPKGERAHV